MLEKAACRRTQPHYESCPCAAASVICADDLALIEAHLFVIRVIYLYVDALSACQGSPLPGEHLPRIKSDARAIRDTFSRFGSVRSADLQAHYRVLKVSAA